MTCLACEIALDLKTGNPPVWAILAKLLLGKMSLFQKM